MKSRFNQRIQIASCRHNRRFRPQNEKLKKHFIMERLEETLGKPRQELKNLISDDLLQTLSKVPFSVVLKD